MNLIYGNIVKIFSEENMRMGKVRVRGAVKKVPLELISDAMEGDAVLLCDGVPIGKVHGQLQTETNHVSGNSR